MDGVNMLDAEDLTTNSKTNTIASVVASKNGRRVRLNFQYPPKTR